MSLVSDIKLIRTDTALDLSQKAEKGMRTVLAAGALYTPPMLLFRQQIRDQNTCACFPIFALGLGFIRVLLLSLSAVLRYAICPHQQQENGNGPPNSA